jgi:Rieske Fe-S protein
MNREPQAYVSRMGRQSAPNPTEGRNRGARMPDISSSGQASRRTLLAGAGAAGVLAAGAVTALSACGSGSSGTGSGSTTGGGSGGGNDLGKTSDIPVGGGKIFASQQVVVTQPTAGTFKGFSAICTHQGCTVASVSNGIIQCPCHGSRYSIMDGSVQAGPATAPLPAKPVTVKGGELLLG